MECDFGGWTDVFYIVELRIGKIVAFLTIFDNMECIIQQNDKGKSIETFVIDKKSKDKTIFDIVLDVCEVGKIDEKKLLFRVLHPIAGDPLFTPTLVT